MAAIAPPQQRGYAPLYRRGMRCPGCDGAQWIVGRFSAECAECCTALTIAPADAPRAGPERLPAWAVRP